jgi:hypothetical protein
LVMRSQSRAVTVLDMVTTFASRKGRIKFIELRELIVILIDFGIKLWAC